MIFVFAGLGLVLVGTIYIGSVVFGIEPQRIDTLDTAPAFTQTIEREAP